jgi:hypothetical protein
MPNEIIFDSYLLPTAEDTFHYFHGAKCFCVLDLNLEHHQILLLAKSWQYTSCMTPFGANRNFHGKQSFKFINGQFTR